jgi:hypothetical protein
VSREPSSQAVHQSPLVGPADGENHKNDNTLRARVGQPANVDRRGPLLKAFGVGRYLVAPSSPRGRSPRSKSCPQQRCFGYRRALRDYVLGREATGQLDDTDRDHLGHGGIHVGPGWHDQDHGLDLLRVSAATRTGGTATSATSISGWEVKLGLRQSVGFLVNVFFTPRMRFVWIEEVGRSLTHLFTSPPT